MDNIKGGKRSGAGRKPAQEGRPLNKRISVMLTDSDRIALDLAAKKEGIAPSQMARKLISENLPVTF